jgi:hypothetical protein
MMWAQGGIVEATIDSVQMVVGEQTGMHLSVIVKPGQRVMFPQRKAMQMVAPGVEIVDAPRVDTTDAADGFIKVTQHLTLTAFEDSLYYIPAQKVRVDGRTLQSKSLALKVLTIEVDTLHPNQFYGPKDVQDNPFQWSEWRVLFYLAVLAMVLYVVCWLAYMRLKSKKPIKLKVRIVKRIPPHQKALNAIDTIKKESSEVNAKAYYTELTDTLRKYIQERFGFNAMEMTSSEIIEHLQQVDDQAKMQELRMLFETADLVKFAKYTADMSENDRNLVSAVEFINTTKQDNVPAEERIEPTVTEQEKQTIRMRTSLKWAVVLMVVAITALVVYLGWQLWELTN